VGVVGKRLGGGGGGFKGGGEIVTQQPRFPLAISSKKGPRLRYKLLSMYARGGEKERGSIASSLRMALE